MELVKGIYAIPATPFLKTGEIDEDSLKNEIGFIIKAGAHGIVGPVIVSNFMELSDDERKIFMKIVVEEAKGKIPVVLNASGVSTPVSVMFARYAAELGADGIIALPPYFKKLSGQEIYDYYAAISKACDIPIVIQNSSDAIGTPMPHALINSLANDFDNIRFVKEESMPNGHKITKVIENCNGHINGVFGGIGGRWMMDEMKRGAYGFMVACEIVDVQVKIFESFQKGSYEEAREIYNAMLPLINIENLLPEPLIKEVLFRRGVIRERYTRSGAGFELDRYDMEELDIVLSRLKKYYNL